MNINKVSQSISSQTPDFLRTEYPLFNKFIEYYYKSQEKTGLGQNIVNNFLQYLDIDKLDIGILDGKTKIVESLGKEDTTIVVESTNEFLSSNGTIMIGDEVIYYESVTSAPNIALSPGVSYEQVKLKWTSLAQIIDSFDGTTRTFSLASQSVPISPPSAQHLIVSVYGEVLTPVTDYQVDGSNITFTTAPRTKTQADDSASTYITYLSGFVENPIVGLDNISGSFGEGEKEFKLTKDGSAYDPVADEYVIAVYGNQLLVPKVDFFLDRSTFIFNEAPLNGRQLSLYVVEAPIPSYGTGASGYARISDTGELTSVSVSGSGSGYRFEYPPKINIQSTVGEGAAVESLVNGIKNSQLISGGNGYSDNNPPIVEIESPTLSGSKPAELKAVVTNGSVSELQVISSGSGYTFNPRISFKQPGGAKISAPVIVDGSISGSVAVTAGGVGYTTAPEIYIDEPTGDNPIRAILKAVLNDNGQVASITVVNAGQGYVTTPRVAVIEPTGAQVLETKVDATGRIIEIELLDGGSGYDDIPSVYIVDENGSGTGATAVAAVFNGRITDINITNFGSGYSSANPPKVIIQNPPSAEASVEIGLNEVTGFRVSKSGSGYQKAQFNGCARAASGIVKYTEEGNAVFSNNTASSTAAVDTEVKCLDSLFVKRLLDKYTEQFLPDVPQLDYKKIDVRTAIKSVKDFYSTKGTSFSVAYLFKLLYGEEVTVTYPKDQITKPSAATWSIDTILRATLVSGDPTNIKDGLLTQDENIADPNVKAASALIENYISIKTSNVEIFELVLSEETIQGTFVVPYKTKLAEPLNTTESIITVDSTIGWPERNGEFIIGGTELIQYKEKSLNQFIECTRSVNNVVEDWDSATEVTSNLTVTVNKGTLQEVVLNVVGIVDARQTTLTDTGSYYLAGDKLTVSKLGGTSQRAELKTWLYNVKKLIEVDNIAFGGIDNRFATVTCENPHGLLVGDQVTIYGANPIIYNGTFLVTSRDSTTVFQYQLPQPAESVPQGNILVSVDLNKGKSTNSAVFNAIGPYTTNIQNSFFNNDYVYVASTGIPNYNIGPFVGSALLPGNQRKLNRFPLTAQTISTKNNIVPGPIGTWVNGVSIWSYKSTETKTFGPLTSINITNAGSNYDAASPPAINILNGGGSGAAASVTVNGSITEIIVDDGGTGYTSSPLVSIVGGGGSGAAATAIVTKGVVSRILMNSGGTGYTSQPSITIVGGGGSGASATAQVRGPIKSVSIDEGGQSYTSKPDIELSSGSGAVAQAIVNNGRIVSIAIISAGSGYTTAPEISIQGDGFGAVARATIDTDGENAGRVTGITIINKGINYVQGTTVVNLTSVGSGATFESNVFQWTYNLEKTTTVDSAKGAVFSGYNNQYGGEYAHISNPQRLRYILGDNLFQNTDGSISEQETQLDHSPIIGWAFDGNPIYGPYGYSDPTDQSSEIERLDTSYRLKTNLVYDEVSNPNPVRTAGPLLADEPAGNFIEDYEYSFASGDLDQYNGRFCKTPDFPDGRYCYFVTIDTTEDGNALFPYVLGPSYNSIVDNWNLNKDAIQQNIPTGVVRYRDPYENVDIDVERAPNASTNALTLENGDILLFEVEDENRDGIIDQAEQDDPDQMFEESPLQLFDYFPKVKLDSKVDIEVETITKFEDAFVTGFIIEDPGASYQVDDILVFDNTDTDGTGVSARVSKITGEDITSYTFETIEDQYYGVLTTDAAHNIVKDDVVYVNYTPVMDNTNKQFIVRQYKGIEELVITQTGSGYTEDIPPTIKIEGNGISGELSAVVTSVGSIEEVNIVNSGSGYTENPRVIISHPQVFKKTEYYLSLISNEDYVKINDVYVNEEKETFFVGKTKDSNGKEVAFLSKFSNLGLKEWEETLKSSAGEEYTEFLKLDVDGNNIWIVGENRPNSALLSDYNPDIILIKYIQADDGLSAALSFQKAYGGISGATRADKVTSIKKYSDTRYIIGGYTNTNSANPYDAFIASVDSTGGLAAKRKLTTTSGSEKVTSLLVHNEAVYFVMEVATSQNEGDVDIVVGKATVGTSVIDVQWLKKVTNTAYSFLNPCICIDEYEELYVSATTRLKSDDSTKNSIWVSKFDLSGDLIWNYLYATPTGVSVDLVSKCVIDIFGDLNIAFNRTTTATNQKSVDTLKLDYDGKVLKHTHNEFTANNIDGISAYGIDVDNSGDVYVYGQTSWNRNEFIFPFTTGDNQTVDVTGHYTPSIIESGDSVRFLADYAFIQGYQTASPSTWENGAIKIAGTDLGTKLDDDWTLEFMLYKNGSEYNSFSQTQVTLAAIGDATASTGGLWLYYDLSSGRLECVVTNNTTSINSAGSALQSTQTTMYANNSWQFVGLKKSGNTFTGYVNGIQVFTGTISDTSFANKDLHIGNIPGRDGTAGNFRSNEQLQGYVDNLRLRNRAITPTVPSDVTALPPTETFALAFDWTDDAWFTDNLKRYDYIDYVGFGLKTDKNSDTIRLGDLGVQTNTDIGLQRTAVTPVTGSTLTVSNTTFELGAAGLQLLDYDVATTTMTPDTEALTYTSDEWSSRTATVPSPGSQKLKVTANVKNRYYMKVTNTTKIDNVQKLTINQAFNFTVGSKLVLNNSSGAFVNSGYILSVDTENRFVYVAVNNNLWSNDLDTGKLSTEQFSEASSYGIVGPIPSDVNEITNYAFNNVDNTTPGTFDIDLQDYNLDRTAATVGNGDLDEFATFKTFNVNDYSIRIDAISGSSAFIVGSVVDITSSDISFNAAKTTAQITNLTGVTQITLIANLDKTLQVSAVSNTDEVYVITSNRHYLSVGENIFVDGNPIRQYSGSSYDEYDGSFVVDRVVSSREFIYKLDQVAVTDPSATAGDVSIYVKSPVLKMYYGHQYLFDLSHSSLNGTNLSFSKDSLNKLEYSFNSVERIGTPGVTGEGQPTPTVKLKVDRDVVTNISYYFDPSRTGDDSPVASNSYLDIVDSPYVGTFTVSSVSGATITTGANIIKFPLINEPEGDASITQVTYSTSSKKAVGSIADIRIINKGGFYSKLPVVTTIQSNRKIERVEISEPGTEYAVGVYNGVPINGDGEGGFVQVTVRDGTDDEGVTIPGQIQEVTVTSPGKGYTTASIDVDAIDGILGPDLTGSGAELNVIIPSFGSGAVIFAQGTNVGKIKKLKNNNFGYDYTHDYTLRPEITFPINAQLTSTNILDSISVTDPGSGYSQAPAVVITGGGGEGAIAEATIKNGRIDQILIKDPGAGYSSAPTIELKSSFNYVINLDLGLLQFAYPHGIANGSEVTLNVVDTGDGAEFPLSAGAIGRLNGTTTYYAITGSANSLENDQMKLAITAANAELGDGLSFANAGTGRQQVLTTSFGGAATAKVITSTFLEGELVYQGDSLETATATGYVSTNDGWQIGPRLLKIVDYSGEFTKGEKVTGVISKSSGNIEDLKIAKGVLDIGSITKTTGQFIDDIGKPSEIVQKIQDSYYYQDFSYAIKSSVSINDWKDILIRNVHPASFKVFGELNLIENTTIPNKQSFFQLTKSVELARQATVPNIQSFALVEPIYSEFDNTEVLFRQKRLTSSENILTSVVQRLDDISSLFDGVRSSFPLTIEGQNVVANASQLMIILNGVVQTPNTSFEIQGDSIVFEEPPQPPASVKYVNVTVEQQNIKDFFMVNPTGIFPSIGMTLVGLSSTARLTVTAVTGNTISGFITLGTFIPGETVDVNATGFSATLQPVSHLTFTSASLDTTAVSYNGQYPSIGSTLTGSNGGTLQITTNNDLSGNRFTVAGYFTSGSISAGETVTGERGFSATVNTIGDEVNIGLFQFGETVTNLDGSTAKVEQINLESGTDSPKAKLRYGISAGATSIEVVDYSSETDAPVTDGTFELNDNYQVGSELFTVTAVVNGTESTTLTVTRGVGGTAAASQQEDTPVYSTDIEVTNTLTLSKTAGTYQSTPGLFDIELDDYIIGASSKVVSRVTSTSVYQDPVTNEFISQVNISSGSTFFGLLFNRIASQTYPNVVLDDISVSQINVVEFDDNATAFDSKMPSTEIVSNNVITYDNASGAFEQDESVRNYKVEYNNNVGDFNSTEDAFVRKVTYKDEVGNGFFAVGQTIRTQDTKAEVIGFNPAQSTIFLGKIGRTQSTGEDYFDITFNGDAQLDTAQKKYGSASLLLDGTGDYLSIPTSTELGFGTGNFTVECYIRPSSVTGNQTIIDFRTAATEYSACLYLDGTTLKYYLNGSDAITGSTTLAVDTWYHVTVSRDGTTTKMFLNGSQEGSDLTDSNDYGTTKPVQIGANYNDANLFTGHIDEVRVSNSARYTDTFTPRTGLFQGDANTKLLIHFDGEDGQTYTEDWSGAEGFTNGEDFSNDAILETSRTTGAPVGFDGKSHRYYDAADLIESNKDFVAKEAVYLLTQQYPSLVIPGGNVNCEDDIRDVLGELVEDLRNGSNSHMWDAAALYVDRSDVNAVSLNHIETEVTETVWAYDKVKEMLQYIINNVLWTVSGSHGVRQVTDTTVTDSSTNTFTQLTPTGATYDPATGDMVVTVNSHGLTTASRIGIAAGSIRFTCSSDGNDRVLSHPRKSDTKAYNQVLAVTATTTNTFTVNVGVSPDDAQYTHTFVSADTNAITVLDYTTGDCADVYTTIGNLMDIITDTIEDADLATPIDHLGSLTRVTPAYEFVGGTADAFRQTTFDIDYHDGTEDEIYTHQIDGDGRYRFRDAANLIRKNSTAIVDKTAYDLLQRYPDLYSDMPRNAGVDGQDGTLRCKTDLTLILAEIVKDIDNGGDYYTVQAAQFYLGNNDELRHIRLQVWQSVYAHVRLGYYMKQAINGDLTSDNTNSIIYGDWDITNDPGGCADVQTAIDNLITSFNDIIAPTNNDYNIAADRMYFNRQFIAEEVTGLTSAEFTYVLNGVSYNAFSYGATESARQDDLITIIISMISDLQTGGNNSTVAAIENYLNADLSLGSTIQSELLPTIYAIDQLKILCEKAIKNLLYEGGGSGDAYNAVYTNASAYRDLETPTDIDQVVWRMRDLVDFAVDLLAPAGDTGRSAAKNILYNQNYYKSEVGSIVNNEFGNNTWQYDSFVEDLVENINTDLITTDLTDTTSVRNCQIESVSTTDFEVGETVTYTGGTAEVFEYLENEAILILGNHTGTLFAGGDSLTGGDSGATATIKSGGVGTTYDWYNNPTNINTIKYSRNLLSLVSDTTSTTNLWTNPEAVDVNWIEDFQNGGSWSTNVLAAPDNTQTAEKFEVQEVNGYHVFYRDYNLTSYATFDGADNEVRFDNDNSGEYTFDIGPAAAESNQTFTTSMFVKAGGQSKIRFDFVLEPGANQRFIICNIDLEAGRITGVSQSGGVFSSVEQNIIPYGNGWYRIYITASFAFGFSEVRTIVWVLDDNNNFIYTGTRNDTQIYALSGTAANSDYFGYTFAVDEENGKIVMGAPYDDEGGRFNSGSVYVANLDGSGMIKIVPSDPEDYAYFGWSVAIKEGKVAVGAFRDDSFYVDQGAVYIYDIDGSNQVKIRNTINPRSYDYFGYSVAIDNGKVFVGAPYYDQITSPYVGYTSGAVFSFNFDGTGETKIRPTDHASGDYFGWSVAAAGGKLVVGSPYDDDNGLSSSGSVYIFDADGTNQVKVTAVTPASNTFFGKVVATNGSKVVAGTDRYNANTGVVNIFNIDGTGKIEVTASDGAGGDYFGRSVAISNDKIAVGATDDDDNGRTSSGSVYVYDLDGTNEQKFTAYDPNNYDRYGQAVGLTGSTLYVGTPYQDDSATGGFIGNAGSVYLVDLTGNPGIYVWGTKLNKGELDNYISVAGDTFYNNLEFNIKQYAIRLLKEYIDEALRNQLDSPSPSAEFISFYDATAAADYEYRSINALVRNSLDIVSKQLTTGTHYATLNSVNGISIPTKTYGERDIPVGIAGGLNQADFFYAGQSDTHAEIATISENSAKVVQVYKRFRIDGDITDGPFTMGETVEKQGDNTVTGVVYASHADENFKYLDVRVTGGTWAITDVIVGDENSTTAEISAIEDRLHVINVKGSFEDNIPFKGYTSGETATPTAFYRNEASVLSNTGGKLVVDTETLSGTFEKTAVIYPASSERFLDVTQYEGGIDLQVGDIIGSSDYVRIGYTVLNDKDTFRVGNILYKFTNANVQTDVRAIISKVDTDNNYLYVVMINGTFASGDRVGDYGQSQGVPDGYGTISSLVTTAGAGAARIQNIETVGLDKRLYLSEVSGTFSDNGGIIGPSGHKAIVKENTELKGRVKRSSKGFDGTTTNFKLTIENGTQYLPDPAGHMLIFVNGILQPPGASNAYTAFSDEIQFTEAPESGASFTGYYVGKLRQLDDIGFEFDSLRQSFNLKRNDVFYSLTLTDGVQSSVIRPENNIIVSLNGVIQEPGVGFEIVGSRIIFSEIPRVGSTFAAFSYVGSEADVDAAEVVPPIEAEDLLEIQGETEDREVAVIESSNSLITFDYLGSVFGKDAAASATLLTGFIRKAAVTAGGSGYTSRPVVRIDSTSGFDGNIKALVGVAGVEIQSVGSGYSNPEIGVETSVPDDWTAPNLADYGEEAVDPEI